MLLPAKHIRMAESIFGLGSYVLSALSGPKTIDNIWCEFVEVNNSKNYPAYHTFDNLILAVDFLFSMNLISQNDKGELQRETP